MPTKALLPRLWLCMSRALTLVVLKSAAKIPSCHLCFLESCGSHRHLLVFCRKVIDTQKVLLEELERERLL